jgi:O-antigen/teichoic acid export membrane protein
MATRRLVQGAQVIADQGVYSALTFLAAVLVGRSNRPDELAYYALAQTLVASVLVLQRCILSVPYSVLSRKMSEEARRRYVGATLVQQIVVAAGSTALLLVAAALAFAAHANPAFSRSLLALALALPAMLFRDFVRSVLLADLRVGRSLALSLMSNALSAGALVALYVHHDLEAWSALLILAAFSAPCALAFGLRFLAWSNRAGVLQYARDNWNFGKYTLAGNLSSLAAIQLVPWLLLVEGTATDVAILAAATSMTGIIRPVTLGIGSYLAPLFAQYFVHSGRLSVLRTTYRLLRLMSGVLVLFLLAMAIAGPTGVRILFGTRYAFRWPLVIVAAAAAGEAVSVVLRATVRAIHEPDRETRASWISAVVGIVIALVGIPTVGVYGAAVALMGTQIIFAVTCLAGLRLSPVST